MTVISNTKPADEGKKATTKLPTTIMPSARAIAQWIHPASTCACASKLVSHPEWGRGQTLYSANGLSCLPAPRLG